jgi:tetratricopeptide (TPR) repeat protein
VRRKFAIASLICVFVLGSWARARALRPEARRRSALAALDSLNMERLQYELLYLSGASELQPCQSLLKGKLLLAAKQPKQALEHLEVAVARDETRTRALVLAGEALYRLGRILDAGETWTRVLQLVPEDVDANRWLGVVYFDLGARAESFYYLREVARLAPGDARPHRVMGLLHGKFGEAAEAAEAYQESLRRDPQQPDADSIRLALAETLHRLGRSDEAIATLDQCATSADVVALRATCVYQQGKVDQAWDLLDQALSLNPNHVRALALRGNLSLMRKEPRVAEESLERALQFAPRDVEVLSNLLKAYQSLDDPRVAAVQRSLRETTRLSDAYFKLSEQAALDPRDAVVRAKLGSLAALLEQTETAKSWFRASLYLEPGNQAAASALQSLAGSDDEPLLMQSALRQAR